MAISYEYILLGAVFLIVLLAVEGFFYFIAGRQGGSQRRVNRRLKMLASGDDAETVLQKLRRVEDSLQFPFHRRQEVGFFFDARADSDIAQ